LFLYQDTLYQFSQLSYSLFLQLLHSEGALVIPQQDLPAFFYKLINKFSPIPFDIDVNAGITVFHSYLPPLPILYLKTKGRHFTSENPITGQLWFKYEKKEYPSPLHRDHQPCTSFVPNGLIQIPIQVQSSRNHLSWYGLQKIETDFVNTMLKEAAL
jgi:hypothetical protein